MQPLWPDRTAARPRRVRTRLELERLEKRELLAARLTLSGAQTLAVNANVNASATGVSESEMYVAVDPTNPLNVAGFVHNLNNLNEIQLFFSTDGGATWTRRVISNVNAPPTFINDGRGSGVRFDPSIVFDRHGNLFVGYGINGQLVVGRSADKGNTFTHFINATVEGGIDKWHLATGRAGTCDATEAVYIAWTRNAGGQFIGVAGQRWNAGGPVDGGFTSVAVVNDPALPNAVLFAHPAVGPDGQLYVSWLNYSAGRVMMDRDLSGMFCSGAVFGADITVRTGMTLGVRHSIPVQARRGVSANPIMTVDRSGGPFHGRLYIAFGDRFSGNDVDIYLARSSDQGSSWTVPGAGIVGNVEGASSTDWHPTVAVDQDTGAVGVAYYSGQGLGDLTHTRLWLATSNDGGVSFPSKVLVSTATLRPASMTNSNEFLEYIGLDARNGTYQMFWCDNRGAPFSTVSESFAASASTFNAGNHLVVTGDDVGITNDMIVLRRSPANAAFAEVTVNGVRQWTGLWASLGQITINSLGGDDSINIQDTVSGIPVTVHAGDGNDAINVGSASNTLDTIQGLVTVNGEAHSVRDTLTVNDQGSAAAHSYVVTFDRVTRDAVTRVIFLTTERFVLNPSTIAGTTVVYIVPWLSTLGSGAGPGGGGAPEGGGNHLDTGLAPRRTDQPPVRSRENFSGLAPLGKKTASRESAAGLWKPASLDAVFADLTLRDLALLPS